MYRITSNKLDVKKQSMGLEEAKELCFTIASNQSTNVNSITSQIYDEETNLPVLTLTFEYTFSNALDTNNTDIPVVDDWCI